MGNRGGKVVVHDRMEILEKPIPVAVVFGAKDGKSGNSCPRASTPVAASRIPPYFDVR